MRLRYEQRKPPPISAADSPEEAKRKYRAWDEANRAAEDELIRRYGGRLSLPEAPDPELLGNAPWGWHWVAYEPVEMGTVDFVPPAPETQATQEQPAAPAILPAPEAGGPWSPADSPRRWGKLFGFSGKTFVRRVDDGTIRAKKLSNRSYQVHLSDLPEAKADPAK
jgi:hypothetical protein